MNRDQLYNITAKSLSKKFNRLSLFRGIGFEYKTGDSISITGPNGSGKSTLLQIIAGIKSPSSGKVEYSTDGSIIEKHDLYKYAGFISPLVNPYDELTGYENIQFSLRKKMDNSDINSILERFHLQGHENKIAKYYSSGMKQRLKFICAIINEPSILFLDEPGTNLDRSGKDLIYSYVDSVRDEKLIFIATNEGEERELCREVIDLA